MVRERFDRDPFGDFASCPEPDEDYSGCIIKFAKRLAKEALAEVINLEEYRENRIKQARTD